MPENWIQVVSDLSASDIRSLPGKFKQSKFRQNGEYIIDSFSRPSLDVERKMPASFREEWAILSIIDDFYLPNGLGSFEVMIQARYYPREDMLKEHKLRAIIHYNKEGCLYSAMVLEELQEYTISTLEEIKRK